MSVVSTLSGIITHIQLANTIRQKNVLLVGMPWDAMCMQIH